MPRKLFFLSVRIILYHTGRLTFCLPARRRSESITIYVSGNVYGWFDPISLYSQRHPPRCIPPVLVLVLVLVLFHSALCIHPVAVSLFIELARAHGREILRRISVGSLSSTVDSRACKFLSTTRHFNWKAN